MKKSPLNKFSKAVVALTAAALTTISANAVSIGVDEILTEADTVNPAALSGTVNMSLSGSVLTVELQNTSGNTGTPGDAGNLLTGIGFNLPAGVTISGGSATIAAGSVAVGFSGTDISQEWGFENTITSGHFMVPPATLSVNRAVSTMVADVAGKFAAGSIDSPFNLAGPSFGLNSAANAGGGLPYVQDSIVITLNLDGAIPANLLSQIDGDAVILTFGSPVNSSLLSVPDSGNTLLLLGAVLAGIALVGIRRSGFAG